MQVFAHAGIAATTVLYIVGTIAVWLGAALLIEAAHAMGLVAAQLDYSVLASLTYGVCHHHHTTRKFRMCDCH